MIERLDGKIVYENKWMRVHEDQVRFPSGHQGIYGVVDKPDFAVIVPIHANGDVCLVEQYRYPIATRSWELPMGSAEDTPDISPEDLARNELREETGLIAADIQRVGHLFQAPGYSNQGFSIFVARDLTRVETGLEETESDLVSHAFSQQQIKDMILEGKIKDATSIAALGLAIFFSL